MLFRACPLLEEQGYVQTIKSHYVHGTVTQRQNRVSSVGGYVLLVLIWRQFQAGICVCVWGGGEME